MLFANKLYVTLCIRVFFILCSKFEKFAYIWIGFGSWESSMDWIGFGIILKTKLVKNKEDIELSLEIILTR